VGTVRQAPAVKLAGAPNNPLRVRDDTTAEELREGKGARCINGRASRGQKPLDEIAK
jgi:hypothetical protein